MPTLHHAAPQLLVDDLRKALDFYENRLGFTTDFVYEDFYASVRRDGATLHLKCAEQPPGARAHRAAGEHLDVYFDVDDARALHEEVTGRGAPIHRPIAEQAWQRVEFQVTDPDGHILCFSQPL